MSLLKSLTAWLSLPLACLALFLAWLLWRQQAELGAQAGRLASTESKVSALQHELDSLTPRRSAVSNKQLPTADRNAPKDPELAALSRERAELEALFERQHLRRNALNSYRLGLDALHLSPAALEKAKETILKLWQQAREDRKGMKNPEEIAATIPKVQAREEAELTALLGPTAYENLAASTKVSGLDWTVGTDLWDAGQPLSPEQLQALAVAQRRTHYQRTFWGFPPTESQLADPSTGLSPQDQALLTNSATFLSPAQQAALRQHLLEDNQYNTAMRGFSAKQKKLWDSQK